MTMNRKKQVNKLRAAALALIRDSQFLFRIGSKLSELGIVGERQNGLTLFLAAVTKDLDQPVSVLIKGPTSSGKNNQMREVISLLPPESVITRSSITAKALAYGPENLRGKVFYLYEYKGGRDAQLLTRLLQSEGSLEHEHTVVTGSERGTKLAQRRGAPVILSTTTEDQVYADDETRFLSLRADESAELTRDVLRAKFRQGSNTPVQPPLQIWQEAFRLLAGDKPKFEHPDWFSVLAESIPATDTRSRRDADRFLSLLKAVALCRSHSDGRITKARQIAISLADYAVAYEILHEAFASTYRGAHPNALKVAETVRAMNARLKRPVTIQQVAEDRSWERAVAHKWTKVAIDHKLVRLEQGTHQHNLKPLLPGTSTEIRFLPNPSDVFRARKELGAFVQYFDPLTGRNKTLRRQTEEDDGF
jgi:hypothetical protein